MKRVYLIPNIITAFGLACGLFVIFKVNMIEPGSGTYDVLRTCALILFAACFADLFDGAVARIFRAESEFGLMFDSLADAISFGVAPSVVVLKGLSLEQGTPLSFFVVIGAMLFSLCGVLRLVRYNVKANEVKKDTQSKKHFTGLPIPTAAMGAVSVILFLASPLGTRLFSLSQDVQAMVMGGVLIILGYVMVSRWKFPSIRVLDFRVPSFQLVLGTVVIALLFFYGVLYFFPLLILILSWGYILIALLLSLIRVIAGRRSHTLEDFEPDPDE